MISITAAAVLLLTLPEIVQKLQPDGDIWLTKDHVAKRLFHVNTKSLALIESYFFGSGLVFTIVMIVIAMWS